MRLLLVNPNTSSSVTDLITAEARRAARSDTILHSMTAPIGVPYIETDAEAAIGAYAVLDLIAQHEADHDAAVVAAFGDPGLVAAKQAFGIPVVGLSEAAFVMAAAQGDSFGIVAIASRMQAWYRRAIDQNQMGARFRGFRFLSPPLAEIATVQQDRADDLISLGASLVADTGAGTVIYAGAPLAGFVRANAHRLDFPAIDGTAAAVHLAEALGNMARQGGSVLRPDRARAKAVTGLSPALARALGGDGQV
ncbi:aspartate/glutamate racemase family protein [Pseudotabrizicola algicola]|uniref:Asp/Glu/hydantoin racemase n=1 Tax=Pseudotabrizicola algicola TaxID=2709381 RepID=A0A6B3RRL4_9RHOB|nr:aspartate/glutamate racemase family protein [Pseudotabrizicola algicola]NEX48790.1 Asp/Glu/hydantoin racemase [Pseudotabrizicola algicola]